MLKLLSDSLKIFCLSKNFVNFRIVVDVEFLGFGTSDEKWSTEGNTDFVVNVVEPAQVILSSPGQTDFTQLFICFKNKGVNQGQDTKGKGHSKSKIG